MKSLLNIRVLAAVVLATALPVIAQASSEGTYTPPQPHDTHSAKVCMPAGGQSELNEHAGYHGQSENIVKVADQGFQQNAGRNTLNPLEPDYVWWQ